MPNLDELLKERAERQKESDERWEELKRQRVEEERKDQEYFDQQVAPYEEAFRVAGLYIDLKALFHHLDTQGAPPRVDEVIHIRAHPENDYFVYSSMQPKDKTLSTVMSAMLRRELREYHRTIIGYGFRIDWNYHSIDILSEIDPTSDQQIFVIKEYQLDVHHDRLIPNRPLRSFKTLEPDAIRQKLLNIIT